MIRSLYQACSSARSSTSGGGLSGVNWPGVCPQQIYLPTGIRSNVILLRGAASWQKAVLTIPVNRLAEGLAIASLSKRYHARQKFVSNAHLSHSALMMSPGQPCGRLGSLCLCLAPLPWPGACHSCPPGPRPSRSACGPVSIAVTFSTVLCSYDVLFQTFVQPCRDPLPQPLPPLAFVMVA